jgi:hypothetical protein
MTTTKSSFYNKSEEWHALTFLLSAAQEDVVARESESLIRVIPDAVPAVTTACKILSCTDIYLLMLVVLGSSTALLSCETQ